MARPKSEDKRNAILSAATEVFAERGLSAATSAISTAAGVAEGTLFTYFKTKDELINALYREIKLELADAMMSEFPRRAAPHGHLLQNLLLAGILDSQPAKGSAADDRVGRPDQGVEARRRRPFPRN